MSLTVPLIRFFQFDTTEIADPSGLRHVINGALAFSSILASGCSSYTTRNLPAASGIASSGTLLFPGTQFNYADTSKDYLASRPIAFLVSIESSGVGISNMKFHLREDTAISIPPQSVGLDKGFVQYTVSGIWQPNCVLPSGAGIRLEKDRFPLVPNLFRQDGAFGLRGNDDNNVSQYVYMNLILPLGFPLGTFGACGSGDLRFGLAFDYWNI